MARRATSVETIVEHKRKAKLGYRATTQASARGEEVDPESVERTIFLANRTWDDLLRDTQLLEEAFSEKAAFLAKDYPAQIEEHRNMLAQAAELRKEIEPLQKTVNEKLQIIRGLEERGAHHNNIRHAMENEEREMLHRRRKALGTTDLNAFPPLD